jgi:hypothetical protein
VRVSDLAKMLTARQVREAIQVSILIEILCISLIAGQQ